MWNRDYMATVLHKIQRFIFDQIIGVFWLKNLNNLPFPENNGNKDEYYGCVTSYLESI